MSTIGRSLAKFLEADLARVSHNGYGLIIFHDKVRFTGEVLKCTGEGDCPQADIQE
jgi:hypothetical protein